MNTTETFFACIQLVSVIAFSYYLIKIISLIIKSK